MIRRWLLLLATALFGLALGMGLRTAIGQQAPPTDTKGLTVVKTTAVDLGPEIEGMQGRQLRMRVLRLEPGGYIGIHSHKDRPSVDYVVQGTVTDHRGREVNEVRAGDTFWENRETTHWVENKGREPALTVAVDIFRQQ